jgi:hypothetical protein
MTLRIDAHYMSSDSDTAGMKRLNDLTKQDRTPDEE